MDRERISNKFCLKQLPFYSDLLCEQSCNVDCFKHESIIESDLYEKRRLRLIIDELSRANEDLIRERTLVEIKTRTRFDSFFHQIGQMQKERENAQKSWTKSMYLKDCEIEDLKDAIAKSGRAYLNELNDLKESEAKRAFIERLEVSKARKTAKRLEKEKEIILYPNPTTDVVYFKENEDFVHHDYVLYNSLGVNFINNVRMRFWYKSKLSSFSLITFGFGIYWGQIISKKVERKMLMKFTVG